MISGLPLLKNASVLAPGWLKSGVRKARFGRALHTMPADLARARELLPAKPLGADTLIHLESLLLKNILPFWLPRVVDRELGGFHLHHDGAGLDLGPYPKYVISQARMTWFFAKVSQTPYGHEEHRIAARHGYEYLIRGFLDEVHGGYFWSNGPKLGSTGFAGLAELTRHEKDICAQAFVLYALSEYALATQDCEAASHAADLFELISANAYDQVYAGYLELFDRDWSVTRNTVKNFHGNITSSHKSFGCQVHMLEALTVLHRLNPSAMVHKALAELTQVVIAKLVQRPSHFVTNVHWRDWRPVNPHEANRANYGHELEFIWLVGEAVEAIDENLQSYEALFESIFSNDVVYGMDRHLGGFFSGGPLGRPANRFNKIWWVQAEALMCSMFLFSRFKKGEYAECFNRTLHWVMHNQADWQYGEWHEVIDPQGVPRGDKAGKWKAAYHSGRSALHCLEMLAVLNVGGGDLRR